MSHSVLIGSVSISPKYLVKRILQYYRSKMCICFNMRMANGGLKYTVFGL